MQSCCSKHAYSVGFVSEVPKAPFRHKQLTIIRLIVSAFLTSAASLREMQLNSYHALSGFFAVVGGRASYCAAKSSTEVVYAGESAAFRDFVDAEVSLCQQLFRFPDPKLQNIFLRCGIAGFLKLPPEIHLTDTGLVCDSCVCKSGISEVFFNKSYSCDDNPVAGNAFVSNITQHFVNDAHALRPVATKEVQLFQAFVIFEVTFRLVYRKCNGGRDPEIRRTVDVYNRKQTACVAVQKVVLPFWKQNHVVMVGHHGSVVLIIGDSAAVAEGDTIAVPVAYLYLTPLRRIHRENIHNFCHRHLIQHFHRLLIDNTDFEKENQ